MKIVTDSAVDLPEEMFAQFNIETPAAADLVWQRGAAQRHRHRAGGILSAAGGLWR